MTKKFVIQTLRHVPLLLRVIRVQMKSVAKKLARVTLTEDNEFKDLTSRRDSELEEDRNERTGICVPLIDHNRLMQYLYQKNARAKNWKINEENGGDLFGKRVPFVIFQFALMKDMS